MADQCGFVLITPARDEAAGILETVESVMAQTLRPARWVIVDDGSVDDTAALVGGRIAGSEWIRLVRRESAAGPADFRSKVDAVRTGIRALGDVPYDFLGTLDADIVLDPDYFRKLFAVFAERPRLGIAGGHLIEEYGGRLVRQRISGNSVSGAVQMFRRPAYEEVGGLRPMRLGGEDSVAEILARMHGWDVATLFHLPVRHRGRVLSGSARPTRAWFVRGVVNRSLGYAPLFQLSVSGYRAAVQPPYLVSGLAMLAGFAWAALRRDALALEPEAVAYLRDEQRRRLVRAVAGLRKPT